MKTSVKVIEALGKALQAELTAINQYFLHAEMCENWGYKRLAAITKKHSIEEMKHAEEVMERILLFDATPTVGEALQVNIGKTVQEQLQNDFELEVKAIAEYNAAIKVCTEEGDNASRSMFERFLVDEEEHADWLETQLGIIEQIGLENYLAEHLKD